MKKIRDLVTAKRKRLTIVALAVVAICASYGVSRVVGRPAITSDLSVDRPVSDGLYRPTTSEWNSLTVETVPEQQFLDARTTEGKIAIDEDFSTPIFSPYSGRVTKLFVKPSDVVRPGQPLFVVEATDTVQGLNDFVAAIGAANKAQSALNLAQIAETRATNLYAGKAVPLKDMQQAQADLTSAQNDMKSAQTALDAARNRLKILGRTDAEIDAFVEKRQISADTPVFSPIAGTVVQRKVGPGQFLSAGATDPVYIIGDLSKVWITAFVRESEADGVAVGQDISFTVLAAPGRTFRGKIDYVSPSLDSTTRRLLVRATIDNEDGLLKPEMFADVTIYANGDQKAPSVPKRALIYEGSQAHVWVVSGDGTIQMRQIKTGLVNGDQVEVVGNLKAGEKIITRGSLFIDRAASPT